MGITNSNETVSAERIECGGTFRIKLSLAAEPDIKRNPTDIVLILDRSPSMAGSPLMNLKHGAKKFIDIIDKSTDIVIRDTIDPCFRILSLSTPTRGTASLLDATSLRWCIGKLGAVESEGASLEFTVQHVGSCSGSIEVNTDISYRDKEGNEVCFPSPSVYVDCGVDVLPEACPEPVDLAVTGCDGTVVFDAGELTMESLGRIVEVDVTLRNVCPNRRVALAAILTEVDDEGDEHERGMKIMTIPAHTAERCRDVAVRCIKFILPQSLDGCGEPTAMCQPRDLRVRFLSHYIDGGYTCCEEEES